LSADALLLANLAATLFLTGLVWYIQVVHLPLFRKIEGAGFIEYAREQRRRNTLLMAVPMAVEFVTVIWLGLTLADGWLRSRLLQTLAPLGIAWIVTLNFYMPQYRRLLGGFNEAVIRSLIRTNWVRTTCWTVRAGMMMWIVEERLRI